MNLRSLIEFSSIAAGTRAVDALVKKAPISLERVGTLQPGKMAVLFSGDVASVEASHDEALRVAGLVAVCDSTEQECDDRDRRRIEYRYYVGIASVPFRHGRAARLTILVKGE